MAAEKSQDILNKIARKITLDDTKLLTELAETAITGKGAEMARDTLSGLCVKAIRQVAEKTDHKIVIDLDNIKIEKKDGGSTGDSELVQGIIIDKERVHAGMPKKVDNAKIVLLDVAIEVKETETDAEIQITDPTQLQAFIAQEEKMLKDMVGEVKKSGANVLFCQKGIDDLAQHYLSKEGIFAVRRVKKSDMEALAKATGGKIVTNLKDLGKADLGTAKMVEEVKIAGDEMVFVRDCKNPKAVSLIIRGGTSHVIDEVERAVNDALKGTAAALEIGMVVSGGGAPEIELARQLREYAESVGGREQLAVNAFAEAVEIIPRTLAESAGMDAIDTLVKLRAEHEKKKVDSGVMVLTNSIGDMWKTGVIEPLKVKTQAIKSASEASEMLLRIDDVIATSKKGGGGGGMPPGMPPGGMGDDME